MKVFRVTGWAQYKTDSATEVDRIQIAKNAKDAKRDAAVGYAKFGSVVVLHAEEIG